MDLPWGDDRSFSFAGSLGLISSNGSYGYNLMTCEWTYHISYSPGLISVHLGKNKATGENIKETGFFGVSIPAPEHSIMASVAGKSSAYNVDKIAVLKDLGHKFYKGKKTDILMVEDAVANFECKSIKKIQLGDHEVFIGQVMIGSANISKYPLIYHKGKYWKVGERIEKPSANYLAKIDDVLKKYKK